jgi:hypothetical protein
MDEFTSRIHRSDHSTSHKLPHFPAGRKGRRFNASPYDMAHDSFSQSSREPLVEELDRLRKAITLQAQIIPSASNVSSGIHPEYRKIDYKTYDRLDPLQEQYETTIFYHHCCSDNGF